MLALYRAVAFAFLVLAAFAWVPPFLDRAGTAALGFAFVALNVGAARRGAAPTLAEMLGPRVPVEQHRADDALGALVTRIDAYGARGDGE